MRDIYRPDEGSLITVRHDMLMSEVAVCVTSTRQSCFPVLDDAGKRSRRAVFVIDKGGKILHVVPWFQPGNPSQYEDIFAALGFEV